MKHPSRTRQTATAIGAIAILVVLLAGVPAALWALAGTPLPAGMPGLGEITRSLTSGPIADATIIKGLAIAGWVAWLQIAVSILIETIAWARGATAPRLALTGPIQPAVRGLIASAAMLLTNPAFAAVPLITATSPAAHASVLVPVRRIEPVPKSEVSDIHSRTTAPAREQAPKIHVVQRGDTLWGVSEHHLGDPLRWPEIFEHNRDRTQPDGRTLVDPNLIVVGWQLELPADALDPATAAGIPESHTDSTLADDEPAKAPTTTVPTNAGNGRHTSVVRHEAAGPEATTLDTSPAPPPVADARQPQKRDESGRDTARRLAPLVGGTLLAASLIALINKLRRTRIRQHSPAAWSPTDPDLQHTELILRHAADTNGANRLDLALRAFATGLRNTAQPDVTIMAVRVDGNEIEILLKQPLCSPPDGFEMTGNPRGWRLQPDINDEQLRELANGSTAPLPALVTLGTTDGDPVMIDLETAGVVTIDGPDDATTDYLQRLATELATSTWTDHLDLVTVGEPLGDLSGSQRVHHFTTIEEATSHLIAVSKGVSAGLAAIDKPTTLASRIADDHGDGWIPTILIISKPINPETITELAAELTPGTGVGIITPGARIASAWHIRLDNQQLHLSPHGLNLDALALEPDTAAAIDQILTDLTVDTPPDNNTLDLRDQHSPVVTVHEPEPIIEDAHEIEFRILGSVDVIGIPPPNRRKSLEIAVYLALHPDGVTDDRLKMVFWPDKPPSRQTFNTTMSMTRCALGTDTNNHHYLPHYAEADQRFILTTAATTDLARLETLAYLAKNLPESTARDHLITALEMVRGQPFDVSRGYEWAFAEGTVTRASLAVADTAHRLAQLALVAGEYQLVEWAATQGLLASPGDEALYRDRIIAAKKAGIPNGARTILDELYGVIETNNPYDCLQPETLTIIESLKENADERHQPRCLRTPPPST